MGKLGRYLLLCVVVFIPVFAFAQELPPPTQSLVVPFNGKADIELCPPEAADAFSFEISHPPEHGKLEGTPPRLTYVADEGYTGEDSFRVLVYDKDTEELLEEISVEVTVLGPASLVSPPSYTWSGSISFSGPTFTIEETKFEGSAKFKFYWFTTELRAQWKDDAFEYFKAILRYDISLQLDGGEIAIPLTLTTDFDPTVPGLKSWTADVRTSYFGTTFAYKFYYSGSDPETSSYALVTLMGKLGDISLRGQAKFTGLTVKFSEFKLTARGDGAALGCAECEFDWKLGFTFTKEAGFDQLEFAIQDLPIPCGVCGNIELYTDFEITFTADSKDITPSFGVSAGWIDGCVRPRVSLVTADDGAGIEGIELYGFEIKCEFEGEIAAKFVTSLDPAKDASMTGDSHFFEYWRFEGPIVGCCGDTGRWQISLYFSRGNDYLFGLSKFKVVLKVPLFSGMTFDFGTELGLVDPGDPAKAWIIDLGWRARL